MKNKHTPEIRFSGFTTGWEQRKLNELVTPVVREVPKPDRPYERISVRSHAKGTFHQKVDDPKTVSMDKLYVVKENDLLVNITFAWEHAIAVASKKDDGLLVSHRFPTYIIDKSDINFIRYSVSQEKFRKKMELISPGGAGRNRVLNKKDFVNLKIDAPTQIEEQAKIGKFFKKLDDIIDLHQHELTTLKQAKQGFLRKMFPKGLELVPEVRFSGFSGDWEYRKLGNHAEILTGGTPKTQMQEYWEPKEIPWMSSGEVNKKRLSSTDNMISKLGFEKSSARWVKKNSVLIALAGQGKTRGTVAINQIPLTTNQSIAAIVPKGELHYEFIFQSLEKRYNELRLISSGDGTRGGLNKQLVSDVEIISPSIEEQIKIGNFFKQFDNMIEIHQRELEVLKKAKEAFLQKMFV
ncbi:restriction endonuclease subunit S [Heyndrickxia acidicola]|uniref:Restriction endonuclease subunit S n=1 Tax=Heyndrickxia acidicola TaxID=209389 RepID=A0ABU6MIJ5_9BACI|nr:restriction endonuclease subunit S [Heyndrickxia acidicola]MED1204213.1 restriction endonuclease subunit S [Heyndrickxia acidicola]